MALRQAEGGTSGGVVSDSVVATRSMDRCGDMAGRTRVPIVVRSALGQRKWFCLCRRQ